MNMPHTLPLCLVPHLWWVMKKWSFFIVAFTFLKSTQILNFPFFFGTTIINDNHVAFSTGCIKLVADNVMFHYYNIIWINLYLAWCANGMVISNSILCWVNSNGMPFKSLYIHAKTSLYSQKNSSNSSTFSGCSLIFTFTIYGSSLVFKLSFVYYCSFINVQSIIYNSWALTFARISFL